MPHVHFRSFYHFSTLDVTHVRKCTRPYPLYRTASDEKLSMGLGMRLLCTGTVCKVILLYPGLALQDTQLGRNLKL